MDPSENHYLLFSAVFQGNCAYLEECIQNGENLSQRDLDGDTLLHHSVTCGKVEVVTILLHHGMDPNATNDLGNTPLHLAVISRLFDVVEILLQYGADPDLVNKNGQTPEQFGLLN